MDITRLREIREDNDLTQPQMSNILGVKRAAYSLWELGINTIPTDNLFDFANYFNISIDYILRTSKQKECKSKTKRFDLKVLGENLKKVRINNNLSQDSIGTILGVSQAAVNRYEKGNICISTIRLYNFSKKFNISIDELCGRK